MQFFVMFNCQLFHVWMELPLKIFRNVNQQGGKNPFLTGKLVLNVTFVESHRVAKTSSSSIQTEYVFKVPKILNERCALNFRLDMSRDNHLTPLT